MYSQWVLLMFEAKAVYHMYCFACFLTPSAVVITLHERFKVLKGSCFWEYNLVEFCLVCGRPALQMCSIDIAWFLQVPLTI